MCLMRVKMSLIVDNTTNTPDVPSPSESTGVSQCLENLGSQTDSASLLVNKDDQSNKTYVSTSSRHLQMDQLSTWR